MTRIMICLFVLTVIFTLAAGAAFADGSNSYGIMVSCTIPAIPGVNVPLVEESSKVTQNQVTTASLKKQETRENEDQLEKEQALPAEDGSFVITKNFYSR